MLKNTDLQGKKGLENDLLNDLISAQDLIGKSFCFLFYSFSYIFNLDPICNSIENKFDLKNFIELLKNKKIENLNTIDRCKENMVVLEDWV